jgi:hypothetical protein
MKLVKSLAKTVMKAARAAARRGGALCSLL